MKAADIHAYMQRRWDLVADLKAAFWAREKAGMEALEALRIGDGLRRHARVLRPDGPTELERNEDFCSHLAVARMLYRVRPQPDR